MLDHYFDTIKSHIIGSNIQLLKIGTVCFYQMKHISIVQVKDSETKFVKEFQRVFTDNFDS